MAPNQLTAIAENPISQTAFPCYPTAAEPPPMSRILHVSLGPVQGFIRQARRTRDLWAGSFLLSWLSGIAMKAVTDRDGTIEFPDIANDPLYHALHRRQVPGVPAWPVIGSLPNRFKAAVPDDFAAKQVAETVRDAWSRLARAVEEVFLEGNEAPETVAIWHRQIDAFWQISWVFEDGRPEFNGLDRRKFWRVAALPPAEGGDHCTIMGDWQELSGFVRAKGQARDQDAFWEGMRKHINAVIYRSMKATGALELRRSERLCAIALVKRLFPLLPLERLRETIGWVPDESTDAPGPEWEMRRWLRKYPSTAYMAAIPWLIKSWKADGGPEACQSYVEAVRRFWPETPETLDLPGSEILANAECRTRIGSLARTGAFGELGGTLFFADGIARRWSEMGLDRADEAEPENSVFRDGPRNTVRRLTDALDHLQEATAPTGGRRQEKMREASPFYAVLLMDGDHMGNLLKTNQQAVSKALSDFTGHARPIVQGADGLLIYAGGDDVLALLPIHTVLRAAEALSAAFRHAFHMVMPDCAATISAGIVFAHYTTPLSSVLDHAHHALDEEAKEANGRDSVAVAVLRPGGMAAEWVSTWELQDGSSALVTMRHLVTAFAEDDEQSSSFLHNISKRYGDFLNHLSPDELDRNLVDLLLAERLKGKDLASIRDVAELAVIRSRTYQEMKELAAVCRPHHKTNGTSRFAIDGALLVRFLADNGGWFGSASCESTLFDGEGP
jgi:CRISPR-associated protein Cmr2